MTIGNKIISFWKQVRIKSSDMFTLFKVGVGIKVPTHKLHVKDTTDPVKIEGVQSDTSSSTKFLVLDGDDVIKHSEGSGKTTEQVQDIVGAMFTGNTETNITATYEDSDGTIDLVATNTQLTNEQVQDIVGAMFTSNTETRISATYEDSDGTIDLVVDDMTADTNTNLGNTNLTASDNRTYDVDGNSLDFQHNSGSILKIEEDNVTFGQSANITEVNFKFGSNAPAIQIYEASGSGTNFIRITCGALGANRTLTIPDATGTIALTSDISNTNLGNANLTADAARTYNINSEDVTFENNGTEMLKFSDGDIFIGAGGDTINLKMSSGSNPVDFRFYEPPTSGTNYAKVITPALGSNIDLTLPTSTGTLALTSDIAANTNIANTNLTADNDRTLNMDGNDLAIDAAQNFHIGQGTASVEFEVNSESIFFKSGNQAPDFRIYEDSDNGTNYVKITLGALASNRTLTIPDATGTIALTSDLDHDALTNFVPEEHYRWDLDIQSTATINHVNLSSDTGEDGEVLVIDENGDAVWGAGERIVFQVRNDEGATIPAGAPLYSRGEIGGSNRIKVGICDADDSAKMPCIGVAMEEMNTTSTKDNLAIIAGVYNTNISGFTGLAEGDILYVDTSGSAPHLTKTKPTGESSLIQNVGIVLKTNGTTLQGLKVSAIGRTNDVPNLNSGYIFYGNGSNQAVSTQLSTLLPPDLTVDGAGTIHANNVPTLNQSTTGNAATATLATNAQGITGSTDGDVNITSDGEVIVKLDSDNDEINQRFKITDNSDAVVFYVQENGNVFLAGSTITNSTSNNDLNIESDGNMTFVLDRDNDETGQYFSFKTFNVEIANLDESGNLQIDGDLEVTGNNITNDSTTNNFNISSSRILQLQHAGAYDIQLGNSTNADVLKVEGDAQEVTINGTLELGHASDTTIARSAAGTVTIEGNTIATTNKLVDTKVAAYWSSSTAGFYVPLSGATFSENTSLSTASYALMYVVPYDGKILRISSFHQNAASGTSTFEVYIDGDDSDLVSDQRGSDMTTSSFTTKFTEDCPSDWTFSKGEAIAIKRTDSVARYGVTMTVVFEFDTTT